MIKKTLKPFFRPKEQTSFKKRRDFYLVRR